MEKDYKEITGDQIECMIIQNEQDFKFAKECRKKRIAQRKEKPKVNNIGEQLLNFAMDNYIDGFLIPMPFGNIIKQADHSFYYRGENQIYSTSKPNLFREIDKIKNGNDRKTYYFISLMKIGEFINFINKFDIVKKWVSTVLYEALAQHYGLSTRYLDITSDFETALFFACCYYDNKTDKWYPLSEKEIEKNKYGIIFRRRTDTAKIEMDFKMNQNMNLKDYSGFIFPIGYQPFMRCSIQHGYGFIMKANDDLQKNEKFEVLRFNHNPELSKLIYNRKKQGELIYPHEGLSNFANVIEAIKSCKSFSEESFNYARERSHFSNTDLEYIRNKLKEKEIYIGKSSIIVSQKKINEQNKIDNDSNLYERYGIDSISYRIFQN